MSVSQRSRMFKIRHGYSLEKPSKTVPVLDRDQQPLMPTTLARAWSWIKSKKATYFYRKGIFCVRLNVRPSGRETQSIVLANDPGSHFDGFSLKSHHSTHFSMMAESDNDIKDRMETRKIMRHNRRQRHCPYRRCRLNRQSRFKLDKKDPIQSHFNKLPPSTRARWEFRLGVIKVLKSLFPITDIAIEDIQVSTRKKKSKKTKQMSIVCGYLGDKLSLKLQGSGPRYCQNAKPEDYRLVSHNAWRMRRYAHLSHMPPRPEYDTIDNFMSIRGG